MTVRMNWREDAACGDADPDLFFPIGTTGNALRQIDEAKRICRCCPVHIQCLAWALENGVTDGVWGGVTEDERRAIRSLSRRSTREAPPRTAEVDGSAGELVLAGSSSQSGTGCGSGHGLTSGAN
jgi:WhiB family redox-sensing transcriptional regulator